MLVPFIAVLVLIVAAVTGATWYYIKRPKPPAFSFSEVAAKLVELRSADYRVLRTYTDHHGVQRRVESQVTVAGSKQLREVLDPPAPTVVWDRDAGKTLTIDTGRKRATLRQLADMPSGSEPPDLLKVLRDIADAAGEPTSRTTIRGEEVQGFSISTGAGRVSVFADVDTRLPSLVEVESGTAGIDHTFQRHYMEPEGRLICFRAAHRAVKALR